MNVLEKAEKALEYLKANEGSAKVHELQTAAGTLGRCLGALGTRSNCARHYANLLHSAIPTLLFLASHDSAEVRLVGDEALNRAVVGGFAFHSHKTNIILQNQIDHKRNARWIRAALSRICLGECWLRPGVGKIRNQAQFLFPKLSQIVKETNEIQLIVEALESNLPRLLNALGEYTSDEEISELSKAILLHVETTEASVRRGIATCIAHMCSHREALLTNVLQKVFEKLWPISRESPVVLGWFSVIKVVFQINEFKKFAESDLFNVHDYMELYNLCVNYVDQSTDHNIQNCVMECLTVILSKAAGAYRAAVLEKHPARVVLEERNLNKGHRRNISSSSVISSRYAPSPASEQRDNLELSFTGALQLGSLLQLNTPSLSVEDLTIQTPESPASEGEAPPPDSELLSRDLSEKLKEFEETDSTDTDLEKCSHDAGFKINIGSVADDDVPLKYCVRLLASKFLLAGNKGDLIPDRSVRVSLKASALNCISEVVQVYPQAMTLYLDKDADAKIHNISGSSEGTDSNQDNINEYILERNVCYQDSLTDSLSQELNRSIEGHSICKKDIKSLEKSTDSGEKSSKDAPSIDSKHKTDLMGSAMTDSTNPNMTISNFTTNSNMTTSNDQTSGYPMSSSGDVLSSSIDLDMKFDHFGESTTNLDNLKDLERKTDRTKRALKRTDEVQSADVEGLVDSKDEKDFEFQHLSDVFLLLEGHCDPQIRGLVRVCIGNYLAAALNASHGDYNRWRNFNSLPKAVGDCMSAGDLVQIILKGLRDEIHSTVNHSLSALTGLAVALSASSDWSLLVDALTSLVHVEANTYWLCRVNLCKLYERIPYKRLFTLYPGYRARSRMIMNTLIGLLRDPDQKVRSAAAHAIANVIPTIYPRRRHTPATMVTELAKELTDEVSLDRATLSLQIVRDIYFYHDLPRQLTEGNRTDGDTLKIVVGDLMGRLMASSCKHYSQGLLEALQAILIKWTPWKHIDAYSGQGILGYCLDNLDYCNTNVSMRTLLLDLCRLIYPVEVHNIMRKRTASRDIFERDSTSKGKWQHLDGDRVASLAEKFLQVTLKMLNVLVHLIEEVNPNVHLNKGGIALPGSPVRRKTQDSIQTRKNSTASESLDDKASLKRKPLMPATSLRANFVGHFYNEPFYMKLYEGLRAAYSNHKINLDPKSSIFHTFLSTTLDCLAVQLELSTEKEFGSVTEEILYYLKAIMPLCADNTVYCVTQLLKCLFGTNMVAQYDDYMSISDKNEGSRQTSFCEDVWTRADHGSRRSSVGSNASQKLCLDIKNPRMAAERQLLIALENFAKNKSDRKWSTNKEELEKYIKLFEPVVIQSLKSYTMQNDIPLQRQVLSLLNQLLTLRVNYCMLDNDLIFIGFLMKQLDLFEQHEIPNCCDLVNSILMFLVQLSSSKHHTKKIIEIPKLIQLCDGLMASGAHAECIAGLEPVAVKVFSSMGGNVLGRAQQQEAQATREVLFYMLQKTMHQQKVLELVSCILSLTQEHPESYYRYSELATDTLLNLLSQRSVELDSCLAVSALERLLETVYKDVLLEQSRVEVLLKILFKAPPDQSTTPPKLKLRYLSIIMVLLRKVLVLIPESEILLSINYLKSTCVSPQSIFFNAKADVDPLNVLNVNENCANLSPDVVLVRFLFKTLTYAVTEVEKNYEPNPKYDTDENRLLYSVCVNIVVQVKQMLHLTTGCLFPLISKTAQSLLHNEQSGLNTGLYSPDENIPLDTLNMICLRAAHALPLLTAHWSHLLIRLNFLTHKYWQKLVGFVRSLPLGAGGGLAAPLRVDVLQIACVMAYCEYFVENGLTEAVHLTWLLVNRVHILVSQFSQTLVQGLISRVQQTSGASGLLLQAIAARCQGCLKDEFALNVYKILSFCHESQSGALVFLICRIIGKLEPAIAVKFAKLAIERCRALKDVPPDNMNAQLSKEDVQVALELLQRDKVHVRYPALVMELNSLASSVFDLSPLDLSQDRAINPQHVLTTNVDSGWLLNQIKNRCCRSDCVPPKMSKHNHLAEILSNLSHEDVSTVMSCPEFERKILCSAFKVASDSYLREFLNVYAEYERKELEKDKARERIGLKRDEEMTSSIDSNKLTVANTLHVFKKSDNKESKSQFFIPIADNEKEFGNLQLTDDEIELSLPELPVMYRVALSTFDRSLIEVIRLFPKQNRPLSQSENFDLSVEHTVDRYTRRCHQVFQDKLFYHEYVTLQTVLTGYLDAATRIMNAIDEADCDLLEKCIENILPLTIAKNISVFCVISLQYLSFLIKNKSIVESPVHADVSFRATDAATRHVTVDSLVAVTVENVSKALAVREIWMELNADSNANRTQSAISCLYAVVKYLVKDTKPLVLKHYMRTDDSGPKPDILITGDKLVTLVEYWEDNFYAGHGYVMPKCYKKPLESMLVSLARLDVVSNVALIPPIAWSTVEVAMKKDQLQKIELPLQALQDQDVLEAFLFRVNLIGWSNKKQFEEIWVGLLGALQGNGPHCAVRGVTQLLLSALPRRAAAPLHVPRAHPPAPSGGMQQLRNILVGTSHYTLFDDINLERVALLDDGFDGYHYAQFSTAYLKMASDITDDAPFKVRKEVRRARKCKEVDVNSCLQILMDVTSQMLEPKAGTGLAARVALLSCVIHTSGAFSQPGQWCWAASQLIALTGPQHARLTQYSAAGRPLLTALSACLCVLDGFDGLQELSTVHQKLVKSLSSSHAPLRQAALQGCLLQLSQRPPAPCHDLVAQLDVAVRQYLPRNNRISVYEQSLYWTVLFALVELGHPDLVNIAVDFVLTDPTHYCTELVVRGIASALRNQVLPKQLRSAAVDKFLGSTDSRAERHVVLILMLHLFTVDDKLLNSKNATDVSNMDPDVLMTSMERITLLYKTLKQTKERESKRIIVAALKYFLRETLPPAATLSRVVLEFLDWCRDAERLNAGVLSDRDRFIECSVMNAEVVFEVFEASIALEQLPVLSGWTFEALGHLLSDKLSAGVTPHALLTLLVAASASPLTRAAAPLTRAALHAGLRARTHADPAPPADLPYADKRLLCVVATHSDYTTAQLEKLKELCERNERLQDLTACLNLKLSMQS
ncbi:huntingtin isoform X1 [Bombyx mori]|uniref:Huntingtin n=1 Tax=Bombyx mori TaxID=7091 RepID=A0A8R2RA63_BOMMO|nr:huntingtin isoform X3 [Bombyx mori]